MSINRIILEVLIDEAILHVCGVSVDSLKALGFEDRLVIEEVRTPPILL